MDKQLQALQHNIHALGHAASNHFRGVTKMIVHDRGGRREINDEATQWTH